MSSELNELIARFNTLLMSDSVSVEDKQKIQTHLASIANSLPTVTATPNTHLGGASTSNAPLGGASTSNVVAGVNVASLTENVENEGEIKQFLEYKNKRVLVSWVDTTRANSWTHLENIDPLSLTKGDVYELCSLLAKQAPASDIQVEQVCPVVASITTAGYVSVVDRSITTIGVCCSCFGYRFVMSLEDFVKRVKGKFEEMLAKFKGFFSGLMILYVRVSSKEQAKDDKLSLAAQTEFIRQSLPSNQSFLVFSEVCSARNADSQYLLRALILLVSQSCFNVYAVDRFSRNTSEGIKLLNAISKSKSIFKSASEDVNYQGTANRLRVRELLSHAEFESDKISDRVKLVQLVRKPRPSYPKLSPRFGFTASKGVYTRNTNFPILEVMLKLKENGDDARTISRKMNNNGLLSSRGKLWTPQSVTKALQQ
jgi:DNA invertase Pin-like site-specific DNA recombinase